MKKGSQWKYYKQRLVNSESGNKRIENMGKKPCSAAVGPRHLAVINRDGERIVSNFKWKDLALSPGACSGIIFLKYRDLTQDYRSVYQQSNSLPFYLTSVPRGKSSRGAFISAPEYRSYAVRGVWVWTRPWKYHPAWREYRRSPCGLLRCGPTRARETSRLR
jgi:hypothetical protein